jgi:hypothetical protein
MRRLPLLLGLTAASLVASAASAEVPVTRTVHNLPSSNGYGAVMVDLNERKIVHFRERLPGTEEPVVDAQGNDVWNGSQFDAVNTRDLLHDAYFGVRVGTDQKWLTALATDAEKSGYLPYLAGKAGGTGITTMVQREGDLEATTYTFAPRGFAHSGFVMALRLKNVGTAKITNVGSFSLHNFHLGFGRPGVREETGENGETAVFHAAKKDIEERGFAGVLVARPLGTTIHQSAFPSASTSADNAYLAVNNGGTADLTDFSGTLPTADGTVTAFQFGATDLDPGAEVWSGVVFAHHGDPFAVETVKGYLDAYVGTKGAKALVDGEVADWKTFQDARKVPTGLSAAEDALFRQSTAMLAMAQVQESEAFLREFLSKDGETRRTRFPSVEGGPPATLPTTVKHRGHGAVIASLPPGEWTISWIRDASYAIAAMAEAGMKDEAKNALAFYLGAESNRFQKWDELKPYSMPPYQMSLVRYQGFGVEETDFNDFGPNLEFDGFGLFLWALRRYELASLDDTFTKANWPTVSEKVGDAIVKLIDPSTGLLFKDSSIWETHWNGRERTYTYTNLTAAKGLCDASEMASHVGDTARAKSYRDAGMALRKSIAEKLLTSQRALASNREELLAGDAEGCYDAAVLEGISMGLFDPKGSIAKATLQALDAHLLAPAGAGWSRNDDNKDHGGSDDLSPWGSPYDSAEWVITDMRGAIATRLAGDTPRSDRLLDWIVKQSNQNYLEVAETYDETSGVYKFNSPMVGFGAGAYILALAQRGGLNEEPACGAYFDESTLPPIPTGNGGSGGSSGSSGAGGTNAQGGNAAGGNEPGGAGGSEPSAGTGGSNTDAGSGGSAGTGGTGTTNPQGGNAAGGSGPGGKVPTAGNGGASDAGNAGAAGSGNLTPPAEDDGCGCRVVGGTNDRADESSRGATLLGLGLGLAWLRRKIARRAR